MAILKIARMGHPVLSAPAHPVEDPEAPGIRALVADMIETMDDADGTGLAAPQVHVPLRVVVFFVDPERDAREGGDGEGVALTVLINPEIELLGDETKVDWEGCLSVPQMMGEVERHTHIRYRATGLDGKPIERDAHGFHARVVQHECDHLDGILYPSRIGGQGRFGFSDEIVRAISEEKAQAAYDAAGEDSETENQEDA